jgi:hypothetical protein
MSRTTKEQRNEREIVRQGKLNAKGLCRQSCGRPLETPSGLCGECAMKIRLSQRDRLGCNPWRPGGRGRPPKDRKVETPT